MKAIHSLILKHMWYSRLYDCANLLHVCSDLKHYSVLVFNFYLNAKLEVNKRFNVVSCTIFSKTNATTKNIDG